MLNAAWRTPPSCSATKTKAKEISPKATAKNFETFVAFSSVILGHQTPRTKSSNVIAAKLFNPLETVLENHKEMVDIWEIKFHGLHRINLSLQLLRYGGKFNFQQLLPQGSRKNPCDK